MKIIGKKDDAKGFSVESLVELANGIRVKISSLIGLKNGTIKVPAEESHDIDENTEFELANGTKYKLADLVNQEIDLGNGKKEKLIDLIKSGKVKLAAEKTDDKESEDEKAAREKEEGKKKEESIKNCGCSGKANGEHKESCAMYNDKEAVAFRNAKLANDPLALANAKIKTMEDEIKALKDAGKHIESFVKINNARAASASEEQVVLQNGTLESGSMEAGLNRAKEYFSKN